MRQTKQFEQDKREAIEFALLNGWSYKKIAAELNCSYRTINKVSKSIASPKPDVKSELEQMVLKGIKTIRITTVLKKL